MFITGRNWDESGIEEGQFFHLLDVREGNEIDTIHGQGTPALLLVRTTDNPEGEWFSIFGEAILSQVRRADKDEFPVEVTIVRSPNKAGTYEYKELATREQVEKNS